MPTVLVNPPDRHGAITTGLPGETRAHCRGIPSRQALVPGHAAELTRLAARAVQRAEKRPRAPVHRRAGRFRCHTTVMPPEEY